MFCEITLQVLVQEGYPGKGVKSGNHRNNVSKGKRPSDETTLSRKTLTRQFQTL